MIDPVDDNPQDLTVYDLAERVAAGRPTSDAAYREVFAELSRLRVAVEQTHEHMRFFLETPQAEAQELIRLKAELEAIVKPPT